MLCKKLINKCFIRSTLFIFGMIGQTIAFSNDCSQYFGVDRAACEATRRSIPEIVVTGSPSPGPVYSPVTAPGVTPSSQPPQVPLAPAQNDNAQDERQRRRAECLRRVKQEGEHCESTYSTYGQAMCIVSGGVFGRFAYTRVPAFAKESAGAGAAGLVGLKCTDMTNAAKRWCQKQVEEKINAECN